MTNKTFVSSIQDINSYQRKILPPWRCNKFAFPKHLDCGSLRKAEELVQWLKRKPQPISHQTGFVMHFHRKIGSMRDFSHFRAGGACMYDAQMCQDTRKCYMEHQRSKERCEGTCSMSHWPARPAQGNLLKVSLRGSKNKVIFMEALWELSQSCAFLCPNRFPQLLC